MKNVFIAAATLTSIATGVLAGASDVLIAEEPRVMASAAPATDWSGFYLGAGLSANSAQDMPDGGVTVNVEGVISNSTIGARDIAGFVLAGYSHQVGKTIFSVEADYAADSAITFGFDPDLLAGGFGGTETCSFPKTCAEFTTLSTLTPRGHVRASLGRELSQGLMAFVSLGVAIADISYYGSYASAMSPTVGSSTSIDGLAITNTQVGLSLGAGLQSMISDNLILRGEVIHDDYGLLATPPFFTTISTPDSSVSVNINEGIVYSNVSARVSLIYKF